MATVATSLPVSSTDARPSSTFWRGLGVIVGLAIAIRLAWSLVVLQGGPMHGDAADYFQDAVRLTTGSQAAQAFYWPPGTAYLLSVIFHWTGPSELAARVTMAVLAGLQAGLVGWLARGLSGSRLAGFVSAGIWAVYPPAVMYAGQSGSQHLSAFCLAGGLLYSIRCVNTPSIRNVLLCGLLLGLGCLTRPSMLSLVALLPVMGTWTWWTSRRTEAPRSFWSVQQPVGLALAVVVTVLMPTLVRNASAGGGFTLSTNNERNFFIGNNPYTPWYKTSHLAQRPLADHPEEVQQYLTRYYNAEHPRQAMKQAAWEHIREQPGLFLLRTANRARAFWGFDYLSSRMLQQTHNLGTPLFLMALAIEAGGYVLVMLLAFHGLTKWKQLDGPVRTWLVSGTAAYAAPYLLAFSAGTYHYPVLGLLIPFAGVAVVEGERFSFPWTVFRGKAWLTLATLFLAIQAEYLYFALRFAD